MNTSASTQRHSVEQLADAFMASYRAGKCPTVEEFAAQYPELADQLRSLLAALVLLEQNVPPADNHYAANGTSGHELREIGDFKIVGEIGRGGMGIVYEAIEQSLGRRVALKVMSTAGLLNPVHLERFRSEARAAARLSHNHIVPVYGVGQCKGLHYYAMQFIQGESLDEVIGWLRQLRRDEESGGFVVGPPANGKSNGLGGSSDRRQESPPTGNGVALAETKSIGLSQTIFSTSSFSSSSSGPEFYRHVARLALGIAEALAYAHSEGVLHRDIKPSNLLLDEKGNIWITDFGLAQAEGAEKLTQTGDFVGTLRYMAPERFEGWSDRRSDVYSLGASLYELLTLQPFMQSENRAQMIDRILHDRPVSPIRIDSAIPRDLETIVLKAIAKEPAARYHTADEMAEDLRRFLGDRPILARRSTGAERFVRWCRRNPLVTSLAGAVAILLAAAMVILTFSNVQIRRESREKEAALAEKESAIRQKDGALAEAQEKKALERSRFYAAQMNLAFHAWEGDQPARTVELLETLRPWTGEDDLRGFEWYYLYRLTHRNLLRTWRAATEAITSVTWSPDGSMMATTPGNGSVRLWDARTGTVLRELPVNSTVWRVQFSPDGKLIAAVTQLPASEVVVWDLKTGKALWRRKGSDCAIGVRSLAFSPDMRVLATGAATANEKSGEIRFWRVSDGELLAKVTDHACCVGGLAFSPDGKTLASGAFPWVKNVNVILWDATMPKPTKRKGIEGVGANDLVFSEDGKTIYTADRKGIQVIDAAAGVLQDTLRGPPDSVNSLRLVPHRDWVVSGSHDRSVRLWDLKKKTSSILGAELASATSVAVDPEGKHVLSGDNEGWTSLRALEMPEERDRFASEGVVNVIAFRPDGRTLVLGGEKLQAINTSSLEPVDLGSKRAVGISDDGALAAIVDRNGRCRIWNVAAQAGEIELAPDKIDHAIFSADKKTVATWSDDKSTNVEFWDCSTGEKRTQAPMQEIHSAAFSPNSRQFLIGSFFQRVYICDLETNEGGFCTVGNTLVQVSSLTYAPDGKTVAAGLNDGHVVLLAVEPLGRLSIRSRLSGHTLNVVATAFSSDGKTLATASADRTIRLWETATGQERATLCSGIDAKLLKFSPDGSALAAVEQNNTVRLLRANADAMAKAPRAWRDEQDPNSPNQLFGAANEAWAAGDLATAEAKLTQMIQAISLDRYDGAIQSLHELQVRGKFLLSLVQKQARKSANAKATLAEAKRQFVRLPDDVQAQVAVNLMAGGPESEARLALVDGLNCKQAAVLLARAYTRPHDAEAQQLDDVETAVSLQPNDGALLVHRAFILGGQRRWEEATTDLTKACELLRGGADLPETALSECQWFLAAAYLAQGNEQAYQSVCTKAADALKFDANSETFWSTLWMCSVAQNAAGEYVSRLGELAEKKWPTADETSSPSESLAAGASLFRAGKAADAKKHFERITQRRESFRQGMSPFTVAHALLFITMIDKQSGEKEEAAARLAEAKSLIDSNGLSEIVPGQCWVDPIETKHLEEEAAALIGR